MSPYTTKGTCREDEAEDLEGGGDPSSPPDPVESQVPLKDGGGEAGGSEGPETMDAEPGEVTAGCGEGGSQAKGAGAARSRERRGDSSRPQSLQQRLAVGPVRPILDSGPPEL